jgi:hypothetical protein
MFDGWGRRLSAASTELRINEGAVNGVPTVASTVDPADRPESSADD